MSGAIEMVAFGVLKYEPQGLVKKGDDEGWAKEQRAREVGELVQEAFSERGWLLTRTYQRRDEFHLLGKLTGQSWKLRERIAKGTLQEVCLAAVQYDKARSEIP